MGDSRNSLLPYTIFIEIYPLGSIVRGQAIEGYGELMSKEEHDWTPEAMWLLNRDHHGFSDNVHTKYLHLQHTNLTTGPAYGINSIGALSFQGR